MEVFAITVTIILFIVGLVLIIISGDRFVDASVALAKRLGIPELVIGATIVSIGTTLPEVLVSATAAFSGSPDIALGNALGSIFCNAAFIAGLTMLIRPVQYVNRKQLGLRCLFFVVAAVLVAGFGLATGRIGHLAGILLLFMFVFYAIWNIRDASGKEDNPSVESGDTPLGRIIVTLVLGAAFLFIGARLLVSQGILLAEEMGVPERVIAVTFIALGTSLPELTTAITSLVKGHSAVSVGNILGANLLNFLLVIGIPAAVAGIDLAPASLSFDLPIAVLATLILFLPMVLRGKGARWQGVVLMLGYIVYCVSQF